MSTSKIYLHVGPFSLKRNWRLAERLLNTRGFKQDPQVVREEGRKIHQIGIYGPGRGIRGKGRLPGQRPALGSEQFQPQLGYPSPGILQRRRVPGLAWGWLDYEGVWGNLEWHLSGAEAAITDTYSRSTSGKSRTLMAVSPHHPPSQESTWPQLPHSRAEDAEACVGGWAVTSSERQGRLGPEIVSHERGSRLLAPDRQCGGDSSNLCLQLTQTKAPLASSSPPAPTLGEASPCWDRESTH